MRYTIGVALLLCSAVFAGEAKKEAPAVLPGFTMCSDRVITEGELKVLAECDNAEKYVGRILEAMQATGFKEVHGLATCNETVSTEKRTVKLDGVAYEWKAIVYTSDRFYNRYPARLLTNKATGAEASRTEEFRLFLRKQIPLAYHGGGWLPERTSSPANLEACVTKQWITHDGVITDVETLKDGSLVKHIVPTSGASPYFLIEKTVTINTTTTEKRIIQEPITLSRDADGEAAEVVGTDKNGKAVYGKSRKMGSQGTSSRKKFVLPDEKQLRDSGAVKDGEILMKVVGVTEQVQVQSDEIDITPHFQAKEVTVEVPCVKTFMTNIVYPYDAGK